MNMKKLLFTIIILILLIIGMKAIFNSSHSNAAEEKETQDLQKRELALQQFDSILPESKILDVPLLNQMDPPKLFNGCEMTSLAMVLNYNGIDVTKNELADRIKKVPLTYPNGEKGNPNEGFVGDMANGPGLSVYNGPVYDLARKYAGNKVVNLTKSPFTDVLKEINQDHPVWIITTVNFVPVADSFFETWDTPQGKTKITFKEHSVVVTGFDKDHIYINNPYGVKNEKLDREEFIEAWKEMGSQAIVVEG